MQHTYILLIYVLYILLVIDWPRLLHFLIEGILIFLEILVDSNANVHSLSTWKSICKSRKRIKRDGGERVMSASTNQLLQVGFSQINRDVYEKLAPKLELSLSAVANLLSSRSIFLCIKCSLLDRFTASGNTRKDWLQHASGIAPYSR